MTILLGLTGSIGMGKSTTSQMFVDLGCALWDADAAVHRLYCPGGPAVGPIRSLWPQVISENAVDRAALKALITEDPTALSMIESIVHPLVQKDRADFVAQQSAEITVCDIPLLFETGAQDEFHATACVYVDPETQRARVMARPGMTNDHFEMIVAKQMPADDKCAKADYVIPTDTKDAARTAVKAVYKSLIERFSDA